MLVWMDVHLRLGRIAASERLRVARKLLDLPALAALFALGRISFSQLRIVTRYATAATDSEFALVALELSVSETLEYCRRYRHLGDIEEDAAVAAIGGQEAAEARAALRAYERRSLSAQPIDEHSTRITLELPNELAAEFLSSLEQVEDWIRDGGERDKISEVGGYGSVGGGDGDVAGASASDVAEDSYRQVRADAAVLMSRRSLAHAGEAVAMADRYRVHASVDVRHLAAEALQYDANEPMERPQLHGYGPISRATAQRIAAASGFNLLALDDDRQLIGQAKKAAPFSKRELRALRSRDRSCRMPGCGATRNLAGHHLAHREHGGQTTMDNGAMVCASCHRLLHEGGFRLELIDPGSVDLMPCPSLVTPGSPVSSDSRVPSEFTVPSHPPGSTGPNWCGPSCIEPCKSESSSKEPGSSESSSPGSFNSSSSPHTAMSDCRVRNRVKAKVARLRRYRLFDAHGREHGTVAAAREAAELFTRVNNSANVARSPNWSLATEVLNAHYRKCTHSDNQK